MLRGTNSLMIALCGFMLLAALDVNAARFYKSVDENGKVIFSDRPADANAEQIDVKVFTPDTPPPTTTKTTDKSESKAKKAATESADKESQQDLKKLQATRTENCKKAKDNLQKLQTVSRLFSQDEKGNRTYFSDEERLKSLATAREAIKGWCEK